MDWNQDVLTDDEVPAASDRSEAKRLIKEGKVRFLPKNERPQTANEPPGEEFRDEERNDEQ